MFYISFLRNYGAVSAVVCFYRLHSSITPVQTKTSSTACSSCNSDLSLVNEIHLSSVSHLTEFLFLVPVGSVQYLRGASPDQPGSLSGGEHPHLRRSSVPALWQRAPTAVRRLFCLMIKYQTRCPSAAQKI